MDTIGKNIELWNGVITGLGEKTDLNVIDLQRKSFSNFSSSEMQSSRAFS